MWSANAAGGKGSSLSIKRANIGSYLGNGSICRSHSRLLEDNDHGESLSSLQDKLSIMDLQGQTSAAPSSSLPPPPPSAMSSSAESSSSDSSSSSLPPIHEDCEESSLDASSSNSSSVVRHSSRKIVEMDNFDLDDIEEAYMLSVWCQADVDVGVGGSSVSSGKSYSQPPSSVASTNRSSSASVSSSTSTSTSTRSRHRGAARNRILTNNYPGDDDDNHEDPMLQSTPGWVASFHVAAEIHNCGDWEPQTGFYKRQPFPLVMTSSMETTSSGNNDSNSIWQEPTPFDYCKKERIEV